MPHVNMLRVCDTTMLFYRVCQRNGGVSLKPSRLSQIVTSIVSLGFFLTAAFGGPITNLSSTTVKSSRSWALYWDMITRSIYRQCPHEA